MDTGYLQHLVDTITDKDNLKKVKEEALKLSRSYSPDEYIQIASELYCSEYFQIQEIGVLLYGYASSMRPTALKFLSETVSTHPSWKVQEVLAISTWDVSDKKVAQVYKLAYRYIAEKSVDR